ncbi:MAG: O-antigen ligase family protein [Acidobacteriota bacterium]|nr:O-antigen ligase family protein [Acidobacteriota bacterium]
MIRKSLFPLLVLFALLSSQISIGYALFGLLAAGWIATGWREVCFRRALSHPLSALAAVYALLVVLSVAFSLDPKASLRALPGLTLFLLVPITLHLVDTEKRARAILFASAASGVGLAVLGLAGLASAGADLQNRIRGPLSHYMTLSGLTMMAGCVLLGFLLAGKGRERWLGLLSAVPFTAMVLTLTRGTYVAAVGAVALYLALARPRAILLFVPALLAIFYLSPPDVRDRAASIADPTETTNRDRIAMARAGGRMIADRPVFGLGPELVKPYYTIYRDPDAPRWRVPHLHNNVLQIAAASGVFAAAGYLALLALFFARTISLIRRSRKGTSPATQPRNVDLTPGGGQILGGQTLVAAASFLAITALSIAGLFEYNFGDKEVLMATLPLLALPFCRRVQS